MPLSLLNLACVLILLAVTVILTESTRDGTPKNIDPKSYTVVETPSGKIKGSILKTWTNKHFLAFRGIPFAQPPVGKLRFKAPVSVAPWQGVKDATQDGKICLQFNMNVGSADEDCLNLNVYTKDVRGSKPVIVFFHPGAFYSMTAASYWTGPQYLMDQDIVLVTANYRLDALGYLSTGDKTVLGNNGMKDQVEALRWIQKHIRNFGGNPNKVTIAGYSAGSTSGFLHMLSPMSRGLFHGVIAMSGGVTSNWVISRDPLNYAKSLASLFNCSAVSNEKMIDCLRKVPATEINSKFNELRTFAGIPMVVFGPVIEEDFGTGEERFLTDDPVTLIKKKQFQQVPVVTGVTENEFISWSSYVLNNDTLSSELINNFDNLAPALFGYSDKNPNEALRITNKLRKFYFGDKPITKNSVSELGKLYSDYSIIYGEYITTKLLVYYNEKPVYSYLLTYKGRYSHAVDPNTNKTLGPAHHDDLIYLFYISRIFPEFKETDPEAFMVKTETSFWKNFALNGDPTPDGSPVQWTPLSRNSKNYLNIGSKLKMENRNQSPFVERMKLWEELFPVN